MTTLDEMTTRIRRVAKGSLDDREFTESTNLTDLGLSSLQISDLIFTIEEDFEIEFDAEQAAEVKTLGELLELVGKS